MTDKTNDKITNRCNQCFNLGMMFNGTAYVGARHYNKDFNVSIVEIQCDGDVEWTEKITKIKTEIKRRITEES